MASFDLTLLQVQEALNAFPGIRLAILFGSLAKGTGTPESDLDLAVEAGAPLGAEERIALISELALRTGRPVDLVDLRTCGEPLLGQVLRHGKLGRGGGSDYGALIARHLFEQADFLPYRNRILEERRRQWLGK